MQLNNSYGYSIFSTANTASSRARHLKSGNRTVPATSHLKCSLRSLCTSSGVTTKLGRKLRAVNGVGSRESSGQEEIRKQDKGLERCTSHMISAIVSIEFGTGPLWPTGDHLRHTRRSGLINPPINPTHQNLHYIELLPFGWYRRVHNILFKCSHQPISKIVMRTQHTRTSCWAFKPLSNASRNSVAPSSFPICTNWIPIWETGAYTRSSSCAAFTITSSGSELSVSADEEIRHGLFGLEGTTYSLLHQWSQHNSQVW